MTTQVTSRAVEATDPGVYVPVLILSITRNPEFKSVEKLLERQTKRLPRTEIDRLLEIDRWTLERDDGTTMEIANGYINGMGNVRTALETSAFLDRISPRYIFLCGIAGSLAPEEVGLGDVVIGKTVDWWNLNKVQPDIELSSSAKHLQIGDSYFRKDISSVGGHTNSWHKRITDFQDAEETSLPSNNDPKRLAVKAKIMKSPNPRSNLIHYGKIVSWEYVLSHGALRDTLKNLTVDGLAIEMEGAGFYSSIKRKIEERDRLQRQTNHTMGGAKIEGFIFRGISDLSHRKGSEAEEWRTLAMENAASALVQFVRTFADIDFRI